MLALAMYGGGAWLGVTWRPSDGWVTATLIVFFLRGAMREPLFRDSLQKAPDDEIRQAMIEMRINEGFYGFVRKAFSSVGQVVGTLLIAAVALSILAQLPGSCSSSGDVETEYRAR
jgi:hypothetical protein